MRIFNDFPRVTGGVPLVFMAAFLAVLPVSSMADEVTDSIKEATDAYEQGDHTGAIENLNYAVQLIQQQKGKALESLLPAAPDGWTAGDAESTAVGAAMFGGGVTAERRYTKGDSSISVQIVTDSPMLQGMMALFTNPMFASSSGGKMEKVAGQKVISSYDSTKQGGDYKIAVANRFLVTVTGDKVSKDEMDAFVEGIDFDAMEKS
ncbi:MAG: hypothetical protein KDI15_12635 [Thiothrix sp.]|nr:hypothetical protein [Thiothrix sp.]HPE59360.1 hypothetical protein [Thiolinea sp.]